MSTRSSPARPISSTATTCQIIDHIDERTLNPGHAIEGAWFIMKEGKRRGRTDYMRIGLDMLDWSWERGWDKEYGGILYYRDVYNHPVSEYWQDMKFWWPHNEVCIATLLAYQLTGAEKYAKMHTLAHDWTDIKGNLFKGCFHVPRMQYECWQLCRELLKDGPLNLVSAQ